MVIIRFHIAVVGLEFGIFLSEMTRQAKCNLQYAKSYKNNQKRQSRLIPHMKV